MAKLTLEEQEQILKLHKKGWKSRAIAKKVLGRETRKSTVNTFLNNTGLRQQLDVPPQGARILIYDIETAPELSYHFGRFKVNISEDFNVQSGHMLSFAAKWYGEENSVVYSLPYFEETYAEDKTDDEQLCRALHELIDQADIVVAHNLNGFDAKVMNARFLYHGFTPNTPYKKVDTLKIAKDQFKFPNNKLDTIARYLGVGAKLQHSGASLWRGCLEGDSESWKIMCEYNLVDVEVLEQVYDRLRPWDRKAPNAALFHTDSQERCVCCGSKSLEETNEYAYTSVSKFKVKRCTNCGKINRTRKHVGERPTLMNVAG